MKDYLVASAKSRTTKRLLNEALDILAAVEIPVDALSPRRREMMAQCFAAVAGVNADNGWKEALGAGDGVNLRSRDIIERINAHFEESISSGSYDDIRDEYLKLPTVAELIINPKAQSGTSQHNPTRGYALNDSFRDVVRTYGTVKWRRALSKFLASHPHLSQEMERKRDLARVPVTLPNGGRIRLSPGEHNRIQKEIVEQFLPRFAPGAALLYLGDFTNKNLIVFQEELTRLGIPDLGSGSLPDVIAYWAEKNWVFIIEAVNTRGSITEVRMIELKKLLSNCTAEIVFVTAFQKRENFRKCAAEIAWETEVWIAESPDHLIHFNGEKFLGPYSS